jgi:hypothetical protein
MANDRKVPQHPLEFIQRCIRERRLYWSYHVNMRMQARSISRQQVLDAIASYEVIESYPQDKYLPSYLVRAMAGTTIFHILFAADIEGDNVRVITAYHPNPTEWSNDFRTRSKP